MRAYRVIGVAGCSAEVSPVGQGDNRQALSLRSDCDILQCTRHELQAHCGHVTLLPSPPPWNTGREASEINRPRENIARARPDKFWPGEALFDLSVCVCVCVSDPERRPKFGSAFGKSPSALCSFERRSPKSFTCRRGFDVTATLWRCYATNRAADARPGRPQAHRRTP